MSAAVNDEAAPPRGRERSAQWADIGTQAPQLLATSRRYLDQIGLSLQASSVVVIDASLRPFCHYLVDNHPATDRFALVGRTEIEGYKAAVARRRNRNGAALSINTVRTRLGMLRTFFDRIIEWDWPDAPARTPIFAHDLPVAVDPLPRFLDDAAATRLLRAAAADPSPLRRLVIELLAFTGLRVGELVDLEADAVVDIGGAFWLRVPLGKLHNDRYVPLRPHLVEALAAWSATHDDGGSGRLLTRDGGTPLNAQCVARMLRRVAKAAGIGHVHPHQLRHTLATQAINRGMRLEAIAALLGHRSLRMTMVYARIANRTVGDEYHSATEKVEALYAEPDLGAETPGMRRLRTEHRRMLGNGWCTRPSALDCSFESICEGCGFFETAVEFRPTIERQRDHARDHDQTAREGLYDKLLADLDRNTA